MTMPGLKFLRWTSLICAILLVIFCAGALTDIDGKVHVLEVPANSEKAAALMHCLRSGVGFSIIGIIFGVFQLMIAPIPFCPKDNDFATLRGSIIRTWLIINSICTLGEATLVIRRWSAGDTYNCLSTISSAWVDLVLMLLINIAVNFVFIVVFVCNSKNSESSSDSVAFREERATLTSVPRA